VGVAPGGVGDEQALLLRGPLGEFLRAELEQLVAGAGRRGDPVIVGENRGRREFPLGAVALGVRVAVDGDVAEEVEELGGAIAPRLEAKSSGVVSISVVVACPERKCGWAMTFSRKGMLVLTPRIRNSESTRRERFIAIS
jgi:hypothetical protein